MKRVTFFFALILLISCDTDDDLPFSSDLKKRVLLMKSYNPFGGPSFVSDSIIEYYENRLIFKTKHLKKKYKDSSYKPYYINYKYNTNNLLIRLDKFIDADLRDNIISFKYSYNKNNSIQKIELIKKDLADLSKELYRYTYDYEYKSDTVEVHHNYIKDNNINHHSKKTFVVKGNIDSIFAIEPKTMYYYNIYNDPYKSEYLGNANDQDFSHENNAIYGNNREPLISNFLGSKLNTFLISIKPIEFYEFELSSNYTEKYIYKGARATNIRKFNYTFDKNNRLSEVKTSGTFASSSTIKYYYE